MLFKTPEYIEQPSVLSLILQNTYNSRTLKNKNGLYDTCLLILHDLLILHALFYADPGPLLLLPIIGYSSSFFLLPNTTVTSAGLMS